MKIDPPVRRLCQAINALPGIRTVSSCSGHRKAPVLVFCEFDAADLRGLSLLTRAMDRRYWRHGHAWKILLSIADVYDPRNPASAITVTLQSDEVGVIAYRQANDLVRNIQAHLDHLAYLEGFGLASLSGLKLEYDSEWEPPH